MTMMDDARRLETDLKRLLHRMETYNPDDLSSYSLRGRASMAEDLWNQLEENGHVDAELQDRIRLACRKAEDLAVKKKETEIDWVDEIFFKPNRKEGQSSTMIEKEADDRVEEPAAREEEPQDDRQSPQQARVTHEARREQQHDTEEIMKVQREQLESEISNMASQLKASTERMNSTLRNQTGNLDELETLAADNVDKVGKAADNVEDHNKRSWSSTVATWTLLITIFGTFLFCMVTIRMAPRRANAKLPCLFNCKKGELDQSEIDRQNDLRKTEERMEALMQKNEEMEAQIRRAEEAREMEASEQDEQDQDMKGGNVEDEQEPPELGTTEPQKDTDANEDDSHDDDDDDDEQDLAALRERLREQAKAAREAAEEKRSGNQKVEAEAAVSEEEAERLRQEEAERSAAEQRKEADARREAAEKAAAEVQRRQKEEADRQAEEQRKQDEAKRQEDEAERLRQEEVVRVANQKRQEDVARREAEAKADSERRQQEAAAKASAEVKRLQQEAAEKAAAEVKRLQQEAAAKAAAEVKRLQKEAADRLAEEQRKRDEEKRQEAEAERVRQEEAVRLANQNRLEEKAQREAKAREKTAREKADAERSRQQQEAAKRVESKSQGDDQAQKAETKDSATGSDECGIYDTCIDENPDAKKEASGANVCESGECTSSDGPPEGRTGAKAPDFKDDDVNRAALKGDLVALRRYLEARPDLAVHKDSNGWEPLHGAAYYSHTNVIEFLLEQPNVNVNSRTGKNGGTALWWIRHFAKDHAVVVLLQSKGGRVMPPVENQESFTEVDVLRAAHAGDNKLLSQYLDERPDWINALDENGWSPVHEAVRNARGGTISFLSERGANLNVVTGNGSGWSPLGMAMEIYENNAQHPIVQLLVRLGAKDIHPGQDD